MKRLITVGLLVAGLAGQARADEPAIVTLGVGTQKILTVENVQRLAVGDPAIADVKMIGSSQVLVSGVGDGTTTLLIWRAGKPVLSYQLRSRKVDSEVGLRELKELLGDPEDIAIRMVGDRIYLDGQAHSADDVLRVSRVLALYPNVTSFVRAAPEVGRNTEQQVSLALQKHGYRDVKVSVVGSTLFLEGTVDSEADRKTAELIALALVSRDAARP